HMRNLDQLETRLVHRRLECLVALPIAVGLLDHDAALEQQALEHLADVELLVIRVAHAERDVLEVAEQRHAGGFGRAGHGESDLDRRQPPRYHLDCALHSGFVVCLLILMALPALSLLETRVLGVLVEKQHTVPDTYPLTLNALAAGCNQKTSRDPVLNATE